MRLSVNSDTFGPDTPADLDTIREAGFTELFWGLHWNDDCMIHKSEVEQMGKWLKDSDLVLQDIHGSSGKTKCWFSPFEYQRKAGVELVANRMRTLRELNGTGVVVMHVPMISGNTKEEELPLIRQKTDAVKRSIEELAPLSQELGVKLAIENGYEDKYIVIRELLNAFPAEILGHCYDCGHGNIDFTGNNGLDYLPEFLDRVLAVHLHDTDGLCDLHLPPFYSTVDWERLASVLVKSSYSNPLNFEVEMTYSTFKDYNLFIRDAYERAVRFQKMVDKARQ